MAGQVERALENYRRKPDDLEKYIFLMGLLCVPIAIVGLVCFGVGIIPAIIWISAGFAAMYFAVSEGEASRAGAPPAPAAGPAGPQAVA